MGEDYDEEPMLYLLQQPNGYWKIGDEEHWTVCHEVAGDSARLIAAAPELLEQCKYLLENAEAAGWSEFMLADARAAIAKAEGRADETTPD